MMTSEDRSEDPKDVASSSQSEEESESESDFQPETCIVVNIQGSE